MNKLSFYLHKIISIYKIKNKSKFYSKAIIYNGYIGINLNFIQDVEWKKIICDANNICKGYYQIYNYPRFILCDWLIDPVTKHRISKKLNCIFINTSELIGKIDIKNYWELGHLHPIFTLGEAFWYTQDEKYAIKTIDLIKSFCKVNPCGKTIHWKCPMDVAIRTVNICQALYFIKKSQFFNKNILLISKYIAEHVLFISENYENLSKTPNNHYLTNLVGVVVGAVFLEKNFQYYDIIHQCLKNAINLLEKELERQTYNDGFDYENSTYYHCYVTELIYSTLQTLKENRIQYNDKIQKIYNRMLSICKWLGAFDRKLPLIGDQDGSRLYLPTGFFDFDRCDFTYISRDNKYIPLLNNNQTMSGILKIQKNKIINYIKCGNIGTNGKGVHDHNDQLSIIVYYNKIPIIIDTGTYLYTKDPENRKRYRSTSMHSTVIIEGEEQNNINSELFSIKDGIAGKILSINSDSFHGMFVYKTGVIHQRRVNIIDKMIVIIDQILNNITPTYVQYIIPKTLKIKHREKNKVCFIINSKIVQFTFSCSVLIEEIFYSPAYGQTNKGYRLKIPFSKEHKTIILFSETESNEDI